MKIAIMGTGGVGGYYGALLAKAGRDVVFIARGPHLDAIRERGLQVRSVHGDFLVPRARATGEPATIGPVDLVIVATKTYHTDTAARAIKPLVGSDTTVVSLQNGVDAAERIGAVVGAEHLLGGVTWLSASIEAPGVIGQYSGYRRIALGEFDGRITPRLKAAHAAFDGTGATVEMVDSIAKVLWTKFVFIASVSVLGCLTRVSFGEYRSVPESREILIEAMKEVAAVAQARKTGLDADVVEKALALVDDSAPEIKPSMQRDVEGGKVSELESLVGSVVRFGTELGVPTPVMRQAYAILKPGQIKALG